MSGAMPWVGPPAVDDGGEADAGERDRSDDAVSDALQQLRHNHASLLREKRQIEMHCAEMESESWSREQELSKAKEAAVSLQRKLELKEANAKEADAHIARLQSALDDAKLEALELRTAAARADDDTGAAAAARDRPLSVDEQLVAACKAVDTETLVEIAQRFHKMQDEFDEAREQLGISARQLSQSRAECALLSSQLGTANADIESLKRQFRLQVAKTMRLEDLLDESQVALAEEQDERARLERAVEELEDEVARLGSSAGDGGGQTASANTSIEASLADELTDRFAGGHSGGGDGGGGHGGHGASAVDAMQRQVHSMLATAEASLGVAHHAPTACGVTRLRHFLADVVTRVERDSDARCAAKQAVSELTEQLHANEREIQRLTAMLSASSAARRNRPGPRSGGQRGAEPDEYLRTLDTLEAQVAKMVQQPRIVDAGARQAGLDELTAEFCSGTAHLLSVLNSVAVSWQGSDGNGNGDNGDGGEAAAATAFAHHLCVLGRGVVHAVGVATGQDEYDPSAFAPAADTTDAPTAGRAAAEIVPVVRSLLQRLGMRVVVLDSPAADACTQVVAPTLADAACQAGIDVGDAVTPAPPADATPELRNAAAATATVDFEGQVAAALNRDTEALGGALSSSSARGSDDLYPGLTAIARLWVRSCIDHGVLHARTQRLRTAPVDPYAARFAWLDRTRLSDELVREVAAALDTDDRDLVLYLTDLLPPPDFDALSEMIADGNQPGDPADAPPSPSPDGPALDGAAGDDDADDVAFLMSNPAPVSKAEGFIDLIRAIFRGDAHPEPEVHVVSSTFTQSLVDHTGKNGYAVSPPRPARQTRTPLSPSCGNERGSGAAATPTPPSASSSSSSRRKRAAAPPVPIQQRFLQLCRESGASLTYIRVKKILVEEYGPDLFQRHREFFVSHLETTSRAAEEKENMRTGAPHDTSGGTDSTDGGGGVAAAAAAAADAAGGVCGAVAAGCARPVSAVFTDIASSAGDTAVDPEAQATIEHLSQMLVSAKAAIAKAKWQEEAYRVYVRNRDRILARTLQEAGAGEPLGDGTMQVLLGALRETTES